jgi:hypothetical protein
MNSSTVSTCRINGTQGGKEPAPKKAKNTVVVWFAKRYGCTWSHPVSATPTIAELELAPLSWLVNL